MFCFNCGGSLREGAKFCGNCGSKVEGMAEVKSAEPKLVQLAELGGDLQSCKVDISEVTVEGPDDEGELSFRVQYVAENDSGDDWEYLNVRTIVLNGSGQVIDETYDTIERSMPAGEDVELEAWVGGANAGLFSSNSGNAQVVVNMVASRLQREKLGSFPIPSEPYSVVPLKPCTIGDTVKIVSGSLWRTPPDEEKDCRVVLKVLCQNLTDAWLPAVKLEAKLTDKMDRDIDAFDQSGELRPGGISTIDCSTYLKANKLSGGVTATVALNVFVPTSVGVKQSMAGSWISSGKREKLSDRNIVNNSISTEAESREVGERFFDCREILYCIFCYNDQEFSALDKRQAISFWTEQLESDSIARPILLGSPFDDEVGNLALDLQIPGEIDEELTYVVIYYYYESATYSVSDRIDETGVINCEPILAGLNIACAMESISMAGETFEFECDSSTDKSETLLAIFRGVEQLYAGEIQGY